MGAVRTSIVNFFLVRCTRDADVYAALVAEPMANREKDFAIA